MVRLLDLPRPLLMAHRGDAVHAPENTFAAFGLALDAGAHVLETDLWLTSDEVIVCHHDRTLERVTDGSGAIPELTLAEVKQARVRRSYCGQFDESSCPDERVPTLAELLAYVPEDRGLSLELKDPKFGEPAVAAQLVETIHARIEAQKVLLLSFHEELLWASREAHPDVWIARIDEFKLCPTFGGDGTGTSYWAMRLNPFYMCVARRRGLWICPLDPEPEERLERYLKWDVDAVLTHDPAKTRKALESIRG